MKSLIFVLIILSFNSIAQDQRVILAGKDITIPKLGSKEVLPAHSRFNSFIKNTFNRPGPFHGPNCYNTSLIASGYLSQNEVRYFSPEEFEEILKSSFTPTQSLQYKDLIVFDAKASRGHAGFYLGDNLVFHKKSYGTQYHYRITTTENVGVVEENEWTPGPMDDSSLQMNWPELGNTPKAFYRLNSKRRPSLDPRLSTLVLKIESLLLKDLGQWAIARKWGMGGEYLLEDLLSFAKSQKMNSYTIAVLTSLKDQVYIMLEEVNFKNARNPSRVMKELCIPEQSEQFVELINDFGQALGKSKQEISKAINETLNQDIERCRVRPIQLLSK